MITLPDFLFFASISTLWPNPSDISTSTFNKSVSLVFFMFFGVVFFDTDIPLNSLTLSLFLIMLFDGREPTEDELNEVRSVVNIT